MSPDNERLIGRAVADKAFREELLADPQAAAKNAGLQITADEENQIRKAVDQVNADPDKYTQIELQAASAGTFW
jgi:hypothetical protein